MATRFNHRRFYQNPISRRRIGKYQILNGMILTFNYKSKSDDKPLVFVMDTDEYATPSKKKSFSGVNLNYLPLGEVNRFFINMLSRAPWEQDKATGMPKVDLWDNENPGVRPTIIYDNIVKPKILKKRDCWRTYKYNKIASVEQIIFEFDAKPLNQLSEIAKTKKLETISKSDMYKYLKEYNK